MRTDSTRLTIQVAEHAALEQACSGWVRTGLGLVGLGLGVEAIAIIKDSAVDDAVRLQRCCLPLIH